MAAPRRCVPAPGPGGRAPGERAPCSAVFRTNRGRLAGPVFHFVQGHDPMRVSTTTAPRPPHRRSPQTRVQDPRALLHGLTRHAQKAPMAAIGVDERRADGAIMVATRTYEDSRLGTEDAGGSSSSGGAATGRITAGGRRGDPEGADGRRIGAQRCWRGGKEPGARGAASVERAGRKDRGSRQEPTEGVGRQRAPVKSDGGGFGELSFAGDNHNRERATPLIGVRPPCAN